MTLQHTEGLRRNAIGRREVLFRSITAMAPAAAIAASVPTFATDSSWTAIARGSTVIGIIAFLPALLTAAGLPVFSFVTPPSSPVSDAGSLVGVWMLAGLIHLGSLWVNHRQRVMDTGLVHLDDSDDLVGAGAAG